MIGLTIYRAVFVLGVALFLAAFASGLTQAWRVDRSLPSLSVDHLAQARTALQTGNIDLGVAELRSYAHIEPRRPQGWTHLGQVLAAVGDRAGAIAAFEQALRTLPVPVVVYQQLAVLYYQEGRFDDARRQAAVAARVGAPVPPALEALLRPEDGALP